MSNNVPGPGPQGIPLIASGISAHPSWSPDGKSVVVESGPNVGQRDIFVVDVSTKQSVQLTTGGKNFTPVWSPASVNPSNPNDTRIAFVSTRDGNKEIYVMNADGANQRNVTNNPADD